jgi:hypothetical protein
MSRATRSNIGLAIGFVSIGFGLMLMHRANTAARANQPANNSPTEEAANVRNGNNHSTFFNNSANNPVNDATNNDATDDAAQQSSSSHNKQFKK